MGTTEKKTIRLPIEIHEYILAFLNSKFDTSTIMKCVLVCRAWLPFSQFKLYHTVTLQSERRWTRFETLLLSSTSIIAERLKMVRELCIMMGRNSITEDEPMKTWPHQALIDCGGCLPGLTRISLIWLNCFTGTLQPHLGTHNLRAGHSDLAKLISKTSWVPSTGASRIVWPE